MIFVNSNDWFKSVFENVDIKTISKISKIKNNFLFESFFDQTVLGKKNKNADFYYEKISDKIKSIFTKNCIKTNFFEFFCAFSITISTFNVFVEIFIIWTSDEFIMNDDIDFFCDVFCFDASEDFFSDNFKKKLFLEIDFNRKFVIKRDEFFIEM